jgi:hypothetical protein
MNLRDVNSSMTNTLIVVRKKIKGTAKFGEAIKSTLTSSL